MLSASAVMASLPGSRAAGAGAAGAAAAPAVLLGGGAADGAGAMPPAGALQFRSASATMAMAQWRRIDMATPRTAWTVVTTGVVSHASRGGTRHASAAETGDRWRGAGARDRPEAWWGEARPQARGHRE